MTATHDGGGGERMGERTNPLHEQPSLSQLPKADFQDVDLEAAAAEEHEVSGSVDSPVRDRTYTVSRTVTRRSSVSGRLEGTANQLVVEEEERGSRRKSTAATDHARAGI